VRIIAGELKGRPFRAPDGRDTRPTGDRIRESVFSTVFSLAGDISGLRALDLFAGSGALGFEALSRGASFATGVESDGQAARVINTNAQTLGVDDRYQLLRRDATRSAVQICASGPFDVVFADPPYAVSPEVVIGLLEDIGSRGGLSDGALIVYEHAAGTVVPWSQHFTVAQQKRHGETGVSYAIFCADVCATD